MTPKEFAKYLLRDGHCLHCGETEAVSPQHRINRGMGGKNAKADKPSNIIVLCSVFNGQIESDASLATYAADMGWKLFSWQDPAAIPVYDMASGIWWIMGNDYRRSPANTTKSRLGS
jgi:hypothetical protein